MPLSEVRWLQQTELDVPQDDSWLSAAEADQAAKFRFPKRRSDWRLGRWTAKQAVAMYLGLPTDTASLARVEIRPTTSGSPEVFLSNQPAKTAMSLSHRNGTAMCAVAAADVHLGCDLEIVEPHTEAFVRDYFTPEEQALVKARSENRDLLVALIWSAKESALKASGAGLREDTRSVSVCGVDQIAANRGWAELSVRMRENQVVSGWWQCSNLLLRTMIVTPTAQLPVQLK